MLDFSALRVTAEQQTNFDPALALYDLNHRSEPPEMHLPESGFTDDAHLRQYRDLLQRNMNSLNRIVRLRRMIEGVEDGDALGLAISIIGDLSKTLESLALVKAYQDR